MDRLEVWAWHQALGEGVADTAAERVDQVFFGMAVGRVVDPLAAAALATVGLEGVLQPRAPRVDQEVAAFQQQVEGLEPAKTRWRGHRAIKREPNTYSYSASSRLP